MVEDRSGAEERLDRFPSFTNRAWSPKGAEGLASDERAPIGWGTMMEPTEPRSSSQTAWLSQNGGGTVTSSLGTVIALSGYQASRMFALEGG
jgi:hypothetical protein